MKTKKEIQENIDGCKTKLQENIDNEIKFESVMTSQMRDGYQKNQSYIKGWIARLQEEKNKQGDETYLTGYKNAENWLKDEE